MILSVSIIVLNPFHKDTQKPGSAIITVDNSVEYPFVIGGGMVYLCVDNLSCSSNEKDTLHRPFGAFGHIVLFAPSE
jgi:hypothetical protein